MRVLYFLFLQKKTRDPNRFFVQGYSSVNEQKTRKKLEQGLPKVPVVLLGMFPGSSDILGCWGVHISTVMCLFWLFARWSRKLQSKSQCGRRAMAGSLWWMACPSWTLSRCNGRNTTHRRSKKSNTGFVLYSPVPTVDVFDPSLGAR